MTAVPAGLLLQLVQLVLPGLALQGTHHPVPTPGLQQTERKGAGLDPTLCPASFLRRASQNPTLPLTLMTAVVGAQHLKLAVSLRERVRQAPMVEPLTVVAVLMMKAPAAVCPAAEEQQKMRASSRTVWTMKSRGPAVRQRGQMLEVAAVPLSLKMQRACLK